MAIVAAHFHGTGGCQRRRLTKPETLVLTINFTGDPPIPQANTGAVRTSNPAAVTLAARPLTDASVAPGTATRPIRTVARLNAAGPRRLESHENTPKSWGAMLHVRSHKGSDNVNNWRCALCIDRPARLGFGHITCPLVVKGSASFGAPPSGEPREFQHNGNDVKDRALSVARPPAVLSAPMSLRRRARHVPQLE